MKNISTGFGLCVLGLGIAAWPILDRLIPIASAGTTPAGVSAVIAAASAQEQSVPTVVWMGVTNWGANFTLYHRMWSDGRQEVRFARIYQGGSGNCSPIPDCQSVWTEIPPPSGGNGFACRTDLDGNRIVDGADLGIILANWGAQPPCEPGATYPCMTIAGTQFSK